MACHSAPWLHPPTTFGPCGSGQARRHLADGRRIFRAFVGDGRDAEKGRRFDLATFALIRSPPDEPVDGD